MLNGYSLLLIGTSSKTSIAALDTMPKGEWHSCASLFHNVLHTYIISALKLSFKRGVCCLCTSFKHLLNLHSSMVR